ncbi:MAG TPA: PLP-dependent aminotransferase family protein [Steroidobacteraceae bacterium]|nr:PLP-dependent aminotransferase family protein [Steroidobacteraceae bacterium]
MDDSSTPLYLAVAQDMAAMIHSGALKPLERVPSVRRLARQRRVSITTAVASLRELEQRGLIEARPKSGYFVARRRPAPEPPVEVELPRRARLAGTQAILKRLADASLTPGIARLGQALPDPALFPEAALRACLARVARHDPALLGEYPVRMGGSLALREQIARHYAHVGLALPAEELIVTNGCMEALTLAVRAVAGPGDTIAVESPTYFGILQIAESLGVKVIEIPAHPRDGLHIEALRELLAGKSGRDVRAVAVTPSFSNPNGSCMPVECRRQLVRLCAEADIVLIEDDVYGDLQFDGPRPLPCKAFDRDGRVLLCSSFSKSLAPGARLGYIVPGRYRDTLRAAKHMISGATPLLQQEMLADFLRSGRYERHLRRMRRALAQQVMQLSQCVQDAFPEGTRLTQPTGGFVLWVELPAGLDTLALHEEAARLSVDYVPGALFSASGRYANCLRLNAGYPVTPATAMAIRRLGELFTARLHAR